MKRHKKQTYKIFSFDDITPEVLYLHHLELYKKIEKSDENPDGLNSLIEQYNQNSTIQTNKTPREFEMIEKYQFMVHLLITKTFYTGYVDLHSDYLKYIFGDYYSEMLINLCRLGYFFRDEYYQPKEQVRRIHIIRKNIICRQKYNSGFEKYKKRYNKKKELIYSDRMKRMYRDFGKEFIDKYIQNLNQLKLIDKTCVLNYVQNNITDEYEKEKNLYVLDQYFESVIPFYNIDRNNRLYSLLTITNKNLRSYLNIRYILDISNCHPLLYNKFIIDKYNIPDYIINKLYTININILFNKENTIYIQYDSNVFRNLLIENDIHLSEIKGVSIDQLMYISLTSQGRFWDYIMLIEQFSGVERSEVKDKMFQQVFYSKVLGGNNMIYQEEFKKSFPNVFKMILEHRKQVYKRKEIHLSHYLMRMESEIIHSVLRELFDMGVVAVNIHDAIVVLDVEENIHLEMDEIIEIIKTKLKEIGLYGKVKIEKG